MSQLLLKNTLVSSGSDLPKSPNGTLLLGRPTSFAPGERPVVKSKKELAYVLPDQFKLETYERKVHLALFDRVELLLSFIPGRENTGAIFRTFIDAIKIHDEIIKEIEEMIVIVGVLNRDYKKKNRLFQNYSNAWVLLLPKAVEYEEYTLLVKNMLSYDSDMKLAVIRKDVGRQFFLVERKKRFHNIEENNLPVRLLEEAIDVSRVERDGARALLAYYEGELQQLRGDERSAAKVISDDHIHADENHISFSDLFSNIHVGYVLYTINDFVLEDLKFNDIMKHLKDTSPPHLAAFKRYDYRYDPFTLSWLTLQELRDINIYVDDPLIARNEFVNLCTTGTVQEVKSRLLAGDDMNSLDINKCNGLHHAAGKGELEIVKLLLEAGIKVDCRDVYMMTPFLMCVRSGRIEVAKYLIEKGANKNMTDRNGRGAVFEAITNGNEDLISMVITKNNCDESDAIWGFTPLHIAANQGNISVIKKLLIFGCSIYRTCNKGQTAEERARDSGFIEAQQLLEEERLTAPAQLVFIDQFIELKVWIGDMSALDPIWSSEVGITHVVCLPEVGDIKRPERILSTIAKPLVSSVHWLNENLKNESSEYQKESSKDQKESFKNQKQESQHLICPIDNDDDDITTESWDNLSKYFPIIMVHLLRILRNGSATVLICDPTGDSLAPAITAAIMLLHSKIRIEDTIKNCGMSRPSVRLSGSMKRGLEELQATMDRKKLERLNAKIRHSEYLSIKF